MTDYLLIDGTNLIHRCYWAVRGSGPDDPDLDVVREAVYAMTTRLMNEWRVGPGHAIAAFDAGDGGRKALYPHYKANRTQATPVLRQALEKLPFQMELRGLRIVARPGWEADDVLATLASRAEEVRRMVVIATGDKDLLQCLRPNEASGADLCLVHLLGGTAAQARVIDYNDFEDRYGFSPGCWPTYNALVGEPGDNIPGVPGIGPKKATALIRAYGDLANIYAELHLDLPRGITPKDRDSLSTNAGAAYAYLRLTTLNRQVPDVYLEHD